MGFLYPSYSQSLVTVLGDLLKVSFCVVAAVSLAQNAAFRTQSSVLNLCTRLASAIARRTNPADLTSVRQLWTQRVCASMFLRFMYLFTNIFGLTSLSRS